MPIVMPIYYSEVFDVKPTDAELDELLLPFERESTFRFLAMVNTLVSFYETNDRDKRLYVQGLLFQNLTNEELWSKVRERYYKDDMLQRPFFNRLQLLFLMKKVLLKPNREEATKNPNTDISARHEVGKICLIANDVLDREDYNARLENPPNIDKEAILTEILTQMFFSTELRNPPDVFQSIVRSNELCRIMNENADNCKLSDGLTIPEKFEQITGLGLQEYIWLVFSICLVLKHNSLNLEELIANPANFNLSRSIVFKNTNLDENLIEAFFKQTTTSINSLAKALVELNENSQRLYEYDLTPFRVYPLYYVDEKSDVLSCLDFLFLVEKLSSGFFHTILNAIRDEESKDWHRFTGFWGNLFEEYVNERLREVYPYQTQRFYSSPRFNKGDFEAFDGVIDYGDALILMEYKGTYLSIDAKYSGDATKLMDGFDKNLGKAIKQLTRGIDLLFCVENKDTFSQINGDKSKEPYTFGIKDIERIKKVYPVIIAQDFALQFGLVNYKLRQQFNKSITDLTKKPDAINVLPLSLITVQDLERLIPHLGEIAFTEFLDSFTLRDIEPILSFENIFMQLLAKKGIEQKQNEWMLEKRKEIGLMIEKKFEWL